MPRDIHANNQNALAFARKHRRWLLTGFFAVCFLISIGLAPTTTRWQAFLVVTKLLLGAAAVGHCPIVYSQLSPQKKLLTYGASAAGLLLLAIFWITAPSSKPPVDTPVIKATPEETCNALAKELTETTDKDPKIFEIDNVTVADVHDGGPNCYGTGVTAKGRASMYFGRETTQQGQILIHWYFTSPFN